MNREIPITEIGTVRIGQVENKKAATGCTVFISENGMRAGVDVRGGGPASRETQLLNPMMAADMIHAVVLGGGSAFGLGAASGVMKYLEEKGYGFDVGITKVPLVVQSDLFDLTVGDPFVRPDEKMGYEAAKIAFEEPNYKDGNYGAGCGATVGKLLGMDYCMKTGIGSYAISIGELRIGAVVALNALGDIFDHNTGQKIAGLLSSDKKSFRSSVEVMKSQIEVNENRFTNFVEDNETAGNGGNDGNNGNAGIAGNDGFAGNTTLAVVVTNAAFSKAELCKISGMAHDGYARAINPVHSSADGDSIYTLSVGDVKADKDLVGTLAAEVIGEAIIRAVDCAESAYGFPSRKEFC